tara:strand:- start:498 stop:1115 length:618 start_codon:yes stop_codon:yes gene_type:complete
LIKKKQIAIAGNIGVGKTTMTEKLADVFELSPIYESVDDNPYLVDFYDDMKRWSFNLQIFFLYKRFSNQIELLSSKNGFIQDRSLYEDKEIFARNLKDLKLMSSRDWDTYKNLFNEITKFLKKPDLIIYLKASTNTLISRINNRKRDFEKEISLEYIHSLNIYYNQWISKIPQNRVLIIDTNNFNIFKDHEKFLEIQKNIVDKLS